MKSGTAEEKWSTSFRYLVGCLFLQTDLHTNQICTPVLCCVCVSVCVCLSGPGSHSGGESRLADGDPENSHQPAQTATRSPWLLSYIKRSVSLCSPGILAVCEDRRARSKYQTFWHEGGAEVGLLCGGFGSHLCPLSLFLFLSDEAPSLPLADSLLSDR